MRTVLTVADAAKLLGWDILFLRIGLQQGKYPFGVATKAPSAKRYAYKIYPEALKSFIKINFGREISL